MKASSLAAVAALALIAMPAVSQEEPKGAPSPGEIVAAAPKSDWVAIPADDLLVMTLAPDAQGQARQVVIQLMPAPLSQGWVHNIRLFARAKWYDGISVNRVQDNYVTQWGDPNYDNPEATGQVKPLPKGLKTVPESDYRRTLLDDVTPGFLEALRFNHQRGDVPVVTEKDPYASGGFAYVFGGWPLATDLKTYWPTHCYGMVGVGRNYSPDTGSGAELYTVIGTPPRHLDRNIALVGRVIEGMEFLSSLPRGHGDLGFYAEDEFDKRTPILTVRVASDLPEAEQPKFEYLSTDSATFARYADARANRRDPFFIVPAGGADICNIPVPIRRVAK